ncbi:MAG: hypothetical protein NC308_10260 [Clostridium sp.]|nr:hypothetical protein [Bacteroides sp.]MCM1199259.1 hypothetical protein [Clostridium sp.]
MKAFNFFVVAFTGSLLCLGSCSKPGNATDVDDNQDPQPPVTVKSLVLEDFENGGMLEWTGTDGARFEIADNPSKTGINTSDKVGKVINSGAMWEFAWSTYFGRKDSESEYFYLDFSKNGYIVRISVFSPKADCPVFLKLEGDDVDAKEIGNVKTTKANEWEVLEFDYEPMGMVDGAYRNFVILFDAGVAEQPGDFYFDDIQLVKE